MTRTTIGSPPVVTERAYVFLANPTKRGTVTVHITSPTPNPFRPVWCGAKVSDQATRSVEMPDLTPLPYRCERCDELLTQHLDNVKRTAEIERERIAAGRTVKFRVHGGGPGAHIWARDLDDAADQASTILSRKALPTDVVEIDDRPSRMGTERRVVQVVSVNGRVKRHVTIAAR
jgi:hypothetical protein